MSTLVIKRSVKNILIEQANQSTGMFGKFGSSKRLISLLEKENYLIPIDQLQNKSYSQKIMKWNVTTTIQEINRLIK